MASLLAEFGRANDAEDHHADEWAANARKEATDGLLAAFRASDDLRTILPDLWADLSGGNDLFCTGWSIHKDVVDAVHAHRLVPYRPCSVLVYAAHEGVQPFVELALDRFRADVNTVARANGQSIGTALTFAARRNDRPMVEYLLGRGADPAWRNHVGRSAADLVTDQALVARLLGAMVPDWPEKLVLLRERLGPLVGRTFTFFTACLDTGYPAIFDYKADATFAERDGLFFAATDVRFVYERSSVVEKEQDLIPILDAARTGPQAVRLLLSRPLAPQHHSRVLMHLDLAAGTFETP